MVAGRPSGAASDERKKETNMARYIGPVCRLCRREDMKLFLKGDRCYTDKCGYERRAYPPGQHGQGRRRKASDYGEQLREKQKVKRIYGIAERQFRGYYYKANRMKGVTGENLLVLLERRLDNIVYRLGFVGDHAEGRQLVRHGHFLVNGKRVNIPSYLVRSGDVVAVREKSRKINRINESIGAVDRRGVPGWLELDKEKFEGKLKTFPSREDFTMPIREQLIVELYSK
jgi:small subunit ribosomal protein S4